MNVQKIDIFNIFLVLFSLLLAIKLPFQLFLFSYAVLGPLHYLTEINWLDKKNYFFTGHKKWALVFLVLTFLISVYPVFNFFSSGLSPEGEKIVLGFGQQTSVFLVAGFLFAVSLILFKKPVHLLISLLAIIPISYYSAQSLPNLYLYIAVFLPTLMHVYVFTLLFVIYGTIKSKSKYGIVLAILLLLVPVIILNLSIKPNNYVLTQGTIDSFTGSNMYVVSSFLGKIMQEFQFGHFDILSVLGLKIQMFIAFAYTYHYLNWFSKTSVIGWQKAMSKKGFYTIISIWIFSMALYFYNFKTGFTALFFLSFLHVFLEFPLNVTTIRELFLVGMPKSKS